MPGNWTSKWDPQNKIKQMNRQNKRENRLIDSEKKLVVVRGEEGGGNMKKRWRRLRSINFQV